MKKEKRKLRLRRNSKNKILNSCLHNKKVLISLIKWGVESFSWEKPNAPFCVQALINSVWDPLISTALNQKHLRAKLSSFKTRRSWILKCWGLEKKELGEFLQKPIKGVTNLDQQLAVWGRSWNHRKLRLITTILYSTRALVLTEEVSYKTIERITIFSDFHPKVKVTPKIGSYAKSFWKDLGFADSKKRIPRRMRWNKFHLSTKQGPNGPAINTWLQDFLALPFDLKQSLISLGGEKFRNAMDFIESEITELSWSGLSTFPRKPGDRNRARKLAVFPDLEGKTREIAILDYFSQTVLKPIHSYFFKIISKIPQDQTFDQGSFRDKIKEWTEFFSCDLTAATDTIPINLTCQMLEGRLPAEWVDHWKKVLVSLPFELPARHATSNKDKVTYKTGNPMGAYSSWSGGLSLVHHFIVYIACKQANIPWKNAKYCLLGDDILIGDRKLYKHYRKVIDFLEMPVSEAKTHNSLTICEFAKRWVFRGEEITPFPLKGLSSAKSDKYQIATLVLDELHRGLEAKEEIPLIYQKYSDIVLRSSKRFIPNRVSRKRRELIAILQNVREFLTGTISPSKCLNNIRKYLNLPHYFDAQGASEFFQGLFQSVMMDSFWSFATTCVLPEIESQHFRNKRLIAKKYDKKGLDPKMNPYNFAHNFMQSAQINKNLSTKSIQSFHPHLSVTEQIMSMFRSVEHDLDRFSKISFRLTGFPLVLRALALPDLTDLFFGRKHDMISIANKNFSDKIWTLFKENEPVKECFGLNGYPMNPTDWRYLLISNEPNYEKEKPFWGKWFVTQDDIDTYINTVSLAST